MKINEDFTSAKRGLSHHLEAETWNLLEVWSFCDVTSILKQHVFIPSVLDPEQKKLLSFPSRSDKSHQIMASNSSRFHLSSLSSRNQCLSNESNHRHPHGPMGARVCQPI